MSALGSFARWAPSLFSWTEAGRGPAPSLRLPALRAESGTAECGQHSAEVKDRVSLSRASGENAGRAEHEMRIECFARWAPSLFSWTEAGRGPAPSLRLPALRARSGTAECGPAFSRGQGQSVLVAVQRRKRWSCGARNIHQSGICWLRQCSAPPSRMMSKQSMVSTFRLGNAAPIRSQARASRRSFR